MELLASLRPSTSKNVSTMMANSAPPDSRPQRSSSSFFIVVIVLCFIPSPFAYPHPCPLPEGEGERDRRLLRRLGDLRTELAQHLGGVLQALGLRVLDPLGLQRGGLGLDVGHEFRVGPGDLDI